ncbi:hypothetical protein ACP70R_038189 [Stipagrostis hirtigluma subsp. patula]
MPAVVGSRLVALERAVLDTVCLHAWHSTATAKQVLSSQARSGWQFTASTSPRLLGFCHVSWVSSFGGSSGGSSAGDTHHVVARASAHHLDALLLAFSRHSAAAFASALEDRLRAAASGHSDVVVAPPPCVNPSRPDRASSSTLPCAATRSAAAPPSVPLPGSSSPCASPSSNAAFLTTRPNQRLVAELNASVSVAQCVETAPSCFRSTVRPTTATSGATAMLPCPDSCVEGGRRVLLATQTKASGARGKSFPKRTLS